MTGRMQLIVIHKDPLMVLGMLQGAESVDCTAAYASSGAEGLQLAKDIIPDLILVDAALPDAGGLDICRQIKSEPLLSECFVALFDRASTLSDDQIEAIEAFTDSYIAGPLSNQELSSRIQAMLKIKSIRNAFQAGEKRFRRMYEKARVAFMTLDEKGYILSVNPAWEKLLGYKKADTIRKSFYEMLPASDAECLRAYFSNNDVAEPAQDIELNICRKDGSVVRVSFNSFQETDIHNKNRSAYCTLCDLTHKSTNPDSVFKAQQLEFTATLAGGIAHDFNNLLMSIMGNISLAQIFLNPEDKAFKILERAESACNEGKALTHQFIILSKCGYPSKKTSSIRKLLNKSSIIENPHPKVDVVLDLPDDLWKIEVDEYQIRYVLSHLMSNAIESMPDGGKVYIMIRNIISSDKPPFPVHPISAGRFLHMMIKDQGKGISSEHLPRIFDPYYTTKEMGPQKGMGLGLTTVYSIIHKHEGFIFIESEVNLGTTVNIYLPALPG
jgi:PAS domain S-box-containing protein